MTGVISSSFLSLLVHDPRSSILPFQETFQNDSILRHTSQGLKDLHLGEMWTPRDIKQHCDNEKFDKFVGLPLNFFSSERHRKSEVNDYLQSLEVEGKVSVLMGLAAASAKYGHHKETSSKQEVISLSSSVFARKGFLSPSKETVLCSDKGMSFYVDSIEIGMEDILIVSMAHER